MNLSEYEKIMIKIIEQYQEIIDKLTINERESLFRIVKQSIENIDSMNETELENMLSSIKSIYDKLKKKFETFTIQTIPAIFNITQKINEDFLKLLFATKQDYTRDFKAVSVLIRDMLQDFNTSCDNGLESIATFFKISKQMQLSESDISRLVAEGVLKKGTTKEGKKLIEKILKHEIIDEKKFDKYIARKLSSFSKKLKEQGFDKETITRSIENKKNKLLEQKYLQIIDKNGKIRTYSIKSYTDLVVRTRLGEAQTIGTIEWGKKNDFELFQVTGHGTTTPICIPHEWKIYTINKNRTDYPFLTSDKRPLYHPNCQHRLIPRAIL